MKSADLRRKYLDFFSSGERKHREIPSAPLVPENDPTTLFTSSGMQPMVPYLLGQKHPLGNRLVNSQKCFRALDINEVGDGRHTTFFEMLGNWSLGDYFKKEQLAWVWEFLTRDLALDEKRLFVTVFEGGQGIPRDDESEKIWQEIGVAKEKIYAYGFGKNWWSRSGTPEKMPVGEIGGPDSEIFYDFGETFGFHENSLYKIEQCHPNCECGRYLEIGNSVFIQYRKGKDGSLQELPQRSVDFGGGLERLSAVTENRPNIFKTDLFRPIIKVFQEYSEQKYRDTPQSRYSEQVMSDHLRGAVFMLAEGLLPGNKAQGYMLRRLLRRCVMHARKINFQSKPGFIKAVEAVIDSYKGGPDDLESRKKMIGEEINREVCKFESTISKGLKVFEKMNQVSGKDAFDLYQNYGFPIELTEELLMEKEMKVDKKVFEEEFNKHRQKSRVSTRGMFRGGLADRSEEVVKLHTATHLLQAGLIKILGDQVKQTGSNITAERLRFDFTHPEKMTDRQKREVEKWINGQIKRDLPVTKITMTLKEAQKRGALALFAKRYGDKVDVYMIGDEKTGIVSREVCGGPHVERIGMLGELVLGKEEAVGSGKRRLYASLSERGGK